MASYVFCGENEIEFPSKPWHSVEAHSFIRFLSQFFSYNFEIYLTKNNLGPKEIGQVLLQNL